MEDQGACRHVRWIFKAILNLYLNMLNTNKTLSNTELYISHFLSYSAAVERAIFYMQLCDWFPEILEDETVCN